MAVARKLTDAEYEALRTLDLLCWQNAESDVGDWATIHEVAEGLGVSYVWASQLLSALARTGYIEARPHKTDGRRLAYGVADKGANALE